MRKKIIIVTLEAPLPFASAAARWYYVLIQELEKRAYDVCLFSACNSEEQKTQAKKLFPMGNFYTINHQRSLKSKLNTLIRPFSYMLSTQLMADAKKEMTKGFDIIHLEQIWSAWLLPNYEPKSLLSVHYLASIDAENYHPKEWRFKLIFWLQKRTERKLLKKINKIKTCSNRLKEKIQTWYPEKKISSIPWGIDTNLYEYYPDDKRQNNKTIVLIASINWLPGKLAALRLMNKLWPEIKRRNPEAKLQIVGWSARKELNDYLHQPDVEILENVESTKPYFNQASLLLYAPERGSGMKIKILEAMLMGTPVVTNTEGMEGLPENLKGTFALVGESDAQLIDHTHNLLNNITLQNKLRETARSMIIDWCSPQKTVEQIIEQYNSL